jgi:PKD repeat protein
MSNNLDSNFNISDNEGSFSSISNAIPKTTSVSLFDKARRLLADHYTHGVSMNKIYEETLRSMINIFGNMFYKDGNGELQKVSCYVGSPERTIAKLYQENNLVLPSLSVRQISSGDDDDRRRYGAQIVVETLWNEKLQRAQRIISSVPRPVDIDYEITIWAKYNEDMDLILTQIRHLFNPSLDIKTSCNDLTKGFISDEENISSYDVGDREDRIVRKIIRILVKGYIPSPKFLLTNTGKIEELNADVDIFKTEEPEATSVISQGVPEILVPRANAGPTKFAQQGNLIVFDGFGSYGPNIDLATYFWDFGDETTGLGAEVNKIYNTPGVFTVELTVSSADHPSLKSKDTTLAIISSDNVPPTADASSDVTGIVDVAIPFDGSLSNDPDDYPLPLTFRWDFDENNPGEGSEHASSTTHAYSASGDYTAVLTVYDGEASATAFRSVLINPDNYPPTANISAPVSGTQDVSIQFNSLSTDPEDGTPPGHVWLFGDGDSSIEQNPSHAYSIPNNYLVRLTVTDSGGLTNEDTHSIIVYPANQIPTADASSDVTGILNVAIPFDGGDSSDLDGDPLTFRWDFGDGESEHSEATTHTYSMAGPYVATLTVFDGEASAMDDRKVYVNTLPRPNAGLDVTAIVNELIEFDAVNSSDDDGDPLEFTWDFGDGSPFEGDPIVSHRYLAPGPYVVTLSAYDGFHHATDDLNVTIASESPPTLDLELESYTAEDSESISFNVTATDPDSSDNLYYIWYFGDGNTTSGIAASPYTDINTTHAYATPGSYTLDVGVCATNTLSALGSANITITQSNQEPSADIGNSDPINVSINTPISFINNSSDPDEDVLTYLWEFGDDDNTTSTVESPIFSYGSSGTYTATLTVDDGEFNNSDTITVEVFDSAPDIDITPNFGNRMIGVEGIPIDFIATAIDAGTITASGWNWGDLTADSTELIVSHIYSEDGNYVATASAIDNEGNIGSESIIVTVADGFPEITEFTVNPNYPNGATTPIRPRIPATFDAKFTDPASGEAIVNRKGIFVFGNGVSAEGTVETTPTSKFTYDYDYPENDPGDNPKDFNVCAIFINEFSLSGGSSGTVTVQNNNPPVAGIGSTDDGASYIQEFVFQNASNDADENNPYDALTYLWDFGDGNTSTDTEGRNTYSDPGSYDVSVTVTDFVGDTDTATVNITVINQDPVADPSSNSGTFRTYEGSAGLPLEINGTDSSDPEGRPLASYDWDFGDNTSGTGDIVYKIYNPTSDQSYNASLQVTDEKGATNIAAFTVIITIESLPPVIEYLTAPEEALVEEVISIDFDATDAVTNGADLLWEIDFGDQTTIASGSSLPTSINRYYDTPGNFDITASATDEEGLTATSSISIVINNPEDNFDSDIGISRPDYSTVSSNNRTMIINGEDVRIPQTYTVGTGLFPELNKMFMYFTTNEVDGTVYPPTAVSAYIFDTFPVDGHTRTRTSFNLNKTETNKKFGAGNFSIIREVSAYDTNSFIVGTSNDPSSFTMVPNELVSYNLSTSFNSVVEPDIPFSVKVDVINNPYSDALTYVWKIDGTLQGETSDLLDFPVGRPEGIYSVDCSVIDEINDYSAKNLQINVTTQSITLAATIDLSNFYDNIGGTLVQRTEPPELGTTFINHNDYQNFLDDVITNAPPPTSPSATSNNNTTGEYPPYEYLSWTDLNPHPDNVTDGLSTSYVSQGYIGGDKGISTALGATRWSKTSRNLLPFTPGPSRCATADTYDRLKRLPGESNTKNIGPGWIANKEFIYLNAGRFGTFRATRDGDIDASLIATGSCSNSTGDPNTKNADTEHIYLNKNGLGYFVGDDESNASYHKFGSGGGIQIEGPDPRISTENTVITGGNWGRMRYNYEPDKLRWEIGGRHLVEQVYMEWWLNGIKYKNIIIQPIVGSTAAIWFIENTRSQKRWLYDTDDTKRPPSNGSWPIQNGNSFPPFDGTYVPGAHDGFVVDPAHDKPRQDTVWLLSSVPIGQRADFIDPNVSGPAFGPQRIPQYYWMEFNYRDIEYENVYTVTNWTYRLSKAENESLKHPKIKWGSRLYSIGRSSKGTYGYKYIGGAVSGIQDEHAFYFDGTRGCTPDGVQSPTADAVLFSSVWAKDMGRTFCQNPSRAAENTEKHWTVPGTNRTYYKDTFTWNGTTYQNPAGRGLDWPKDDVSLAPSDTNSDSYAVDTGALYRWIRVLSVDPDGSNIVYDSGDWKWSSTRPINDADDELYVVDINNVANNGALGYPFRFGYASQYQQFVGEGTFTYATGKIVFDDVSALNCSTKSENTNGFPISIKGNLHGSVVVKNTKIISGGDPTLRQDEYGQQNPGCINIENDAQSWFGYGTNKFPHPNHPTDAVSWCRKDGPYDNGNLDPIQVPYVQSTNDKGAQGHTDIVMIENCYFEQGRHVPNSLGENDTLFPIEGQKPVGVGGNWSGLRRFSPEFESNKDLSVMTPFGAAGVKLLVISNTYMESSGVDAQLIMTLPYIDPRWSNLEQGNSWGEKAYDEALFARYANLDNGAVKQEMIDKGGYWFDVPTGTDALSYGNNIIGKFQLSLGDGSSITFQDQNFNGAAYLSFYNEWHRIIQQQNSTQAERDAWNHVHFFHSGFDAPTDPHPTDRTEGLEPPAANEWRF